MKVNVLTLPGASGHYVSNTVDLPPSLRQPVTVQLLLNGELSFGIVPQTVHEGVQTGGRSAAGARHTDRSSGAGVGRESQRVAPSAPGIRQGGWNVFPGNGTQRWSDGRVAELERKISPQALEVHFLKVAAAHRRGEDTAGSAWQSAGYRKIEEEVNFDLT